MSRVVWNAVGERRFATGVDRGVLYCLGLPGVPWNGLVAVNESSEGGEVTPFYIDGMKFRESAANEFFKATIEAFTYPDEFELCDGSANLSNGLFATMQKKHPFGLSYRTILGNDLDGVDHEYQIHLVYNATAKSTGRSNLTISDSIDPSTFTWDIFTRPPIVAGVKPTSHFVISSKDSPTDLLSNLEDILYGTEELSPRLPSVQELMFMFQEYQVSIFDAGFLTETYFATIDAGHISESETSSIDGGSP